MTSSQPSSKALLNSQDHQTGLSALKSMDNRCSKGWRAHQVASSPRGHSSTCPPRLAEYWWEESQKKPMATENNVGEAINFSYLVHLGRQKFRVLFKNINSFLSFLKVFKSITKILIK